MDALHPVRKHERELQPVHQAVGRTLLSTAWMIIGLCLMSLAAECIIAASSLLASHH